MKRVFTSILLAFALAGCTQTDRATMALTDAGFTNIEITGYAFLACAEHDTFSTGFRAKGPTGKTVSGAVCSGVFKSQTIRFD